MCIAIYDAAMFAVALNVLSEKRMKQESGDFPSWRKAFNQ